MERKQAENKLKEIVGIDISEFIYIDENGKEKISIPAITESILLKYDFKTIFESRYETIFIQEKGIWIPKGKEVIKMKTEELLGDKSTIHIINEVVEKIKRKTGISKEVFDFIPESLICLENGVLDVKTKLFVEHSPNYYFKSKLPIKYNPEIKCEEIYKFLENILYPEDISVIQEWFGFCLYKRYFIKKAMILFGEKNTGKTVLLNLLMLFIGYKNTTGISLQRISAGDKFAIAALKDKMSNVFDDLSAKDLTDSGGFKIATGGGYMTGEYKFGDIFQFLNYAKHIFATNHIPNVKEINDDAYYDRWIPIQLDNQIEENKRDSFLLEKLTTKEELSGLLNWSLEGLKRLLEKGSFSFNKNSDEIKQIMLRQNNPLVAFVDEVLIQNDGNRISKDIMFKIYSKWCREKKVPRLSKHQLGSNLAKYTDYITSKGGKERVWENVSINPNMIGLIDIFSTGNVGDRYDGL
ncbi:MAG: hypothetical protein CMF72_10260 [Mameliella sp.]|jgi:putative DNA primase/helicase|nr:hypothetical protein [Mameliella sp.]